MLYIAHNQTSYPSFGIQTQLENSGYRGSGTHPV